MSQDAAVADRPEASVSPDEVALSVFIVGHDSEKWTEKQVSVRMNRNSVSVFDVIKKNLPLKKNTVFSSLLAPDAICFLLETVWSEREA